jgi:hypothetical protein
MSLPNTPAWTYSWKTLGTFHSWWLPGHPVDGTFTAWTSAKQAWSPLNLKHQRTNGKYLSGGPWIFAKVTCKDSSESSATYRYGGDLAYVGRYFYAGVDETFALGLTDKSLDEAYNDCKNMGAEAWASMKPAQPSFSAAQELYELKDIPHSLRQGIDFCSKKVAAEQARRAAKGNRRFWYSHAGEWYLAIQFGWMPILNTTLNFVKSFRDRKKAFDQLLKDEAKWVYRSRKLKGHDVNETRDENWTNPDANGWSSMQPVHVSQCYAPGIGYNNTFTYVARAWCCGKFKYFLPAGPRDRDWKNRLYRRIFGLRLTPGQVYSVIPWSWFFDYFGDLGHFMDAVSAGVEDRLVCEYAYVMHERTWTCKSTLWMNVYGSGQWPNVTQHRVSVTRDMVKTYKNRAAATVLGFGLNQENLTLFQQSIIGALGLSKL